MALSIVPQYLYHMYKYHGTNKKYHGICTIVVDGASFHTIGCNLTVSGHLTPFTSIVLMLQRRILLLFRLSLFNRFVLVWKQKHLLRREMRFIRRDYDMIVILPITFFSPSDGGMCKLFCVVLCLCPLFDSEEDCLLKRQAPAANKLPKISACSRSDSFDS